VRDYSFFASSTAIQCVKSSVRRLTHIITAGLLALLWLTCSDIRAQSDQQSQDKTLVEEKSGQASSYAVPKKKEQNNPETEVSREAIKREVESARSSLREAERAKDPVSAAEHMTRAMTSASTAQGFARRVEETTRVDRSSDSAARPQSQPSISIGDSSTLRLLIKMDQGGASAQASGFQGTATNRQELQPEGTGTRFFSGSQDLRGYNSQRGEITTTDGHTVSVRPLIDALQRVAPNAASRPFVSDASGVVRLSPEAQRALAQNPDQLRAIGGIALEVTFQRLALVGVPELRVPGPLAMVQDPVIISLRRLVSAAKGYASSPDKWKALPEVIRYPGGIARINGYVLDPRNEDVFVVGNKATDQETRIDLDLLSVLVNSVWAHGLTPTVSLDPLPDDPAGPQYPRIANVPQDSLVARLLLDADYEMKRINLGVDKIHEGGFSSLAELYAKAPPKEAFAARYWLRPIPLSANALRVSESGRTVLYETGVQALTEAVRVDSNGVVGTGDINPVHGRVAELFTRAYETLEFSPTLTPHGIYALLHGIVDIVTLNRLLRSSGVDYSVLRQLGALPYVHLTGDKAVPSYYTGLRIRYSESGRSDSYISGGVELRSRPTRLSVDRFDDYVGRTLERVTDQFAAANFWQQLNISFTLPKPRPALNTEAEVAKQAGFRALEIDQTAAAAGKLSEATKKDPTDIDAWLYLGWSEAQLGHQAAAANAIERALALGADDFATRVLYLDIALFANPKLDLKTANYALRNELSNAYTAKVYSALYRKSVPVAIRSADRAVLVLPENAEAYMARAAAQYLRDQAAAYKDVSTAIRLFRGAPQGESQRRLSFALAFKTALELDAIPRRMNEEIADGEVPKLLDELVRRSTAAAEGANEAVSLDLSSGLAFATAIRAATTEILVAKAANAFGKDVSVDPKPIQSYADDALRRFPNFSPIRMERAILFQILSDVPSAEREINEAITLNPANPRSYLLRATFAAELSNCAAAKQDLERAEALKLPLDENLLKTLRRGSCQIDAPG
jgi:Tfp pilus assembly protein PilF